MDLSWNWRCFLWHEQKKSDLVKSEQKVPAHTGFISATGGAQEKLTTIDYYPVINHPISSHDTVQECLCFAEEATKEVGQEYTITTFNPGVCMKAYPIIWNWPERYKCHIVMIGTSHLTFVFLEIFIKSRWNLAIWCFPRSWINWYSIPLRWTIRKTLWKELCNVIKLSLTQWRGYGQNTFYLVSVKILCLNPCLMIQERRSTILCSAWVMLI